ncbi:MAG: hypothetical protein K0U98_25250 [Deltaproteobacteria bacterium]|nr:hypothetical protein [Deltaproteobacteria bacterium]
MTTEEAVKTFKKALAGDSADAKIAAALALPEEASGATAALEEALDTADPRLEIAILDALFRINEDPQVKARLEVILHAHEAEGDDSEELYMMARIALNRVEGDDQDFLEAEGFELVVLGAPTILGPDRLAVIVHGTWAKNGTWWRRQADDLAEDKKPNFHQYLKTICGLDHLYSGDEPFIWSGRNRGSARHNAAIAFGEWVSNHNPDHLEVYGHSHGANVAMLSTQQGLPIQKLVMLSPPVRKDYFANWDRVGEAYNVQAAFDPVVGIARGGQRFNLPGTVQEMKLDARSHSASHDPKTWEDNGVPAFLGLVSKGLS